MKLTPELRATLDAAGCLDEGDWVEMSELNPLNVEKLHDAGLVEYHITTYVVRTRTGDKALYEDED